MSAALGSAVILAGGQSKRFGADKKKIILNGASLLETLIARLRESFDEIIISSNDDYPCSGGIRLVKDETGAGPLAGIYSALKICKSAYLYVTACDMPFISTEGIGLIKEKARAAVYDAVIARREDGFYEPFNACYHKNILPELYACLERGIYRPAALIAKFKNCCVLPYDSRIFFNINYQDDAHEAQERSFYESRKING